MAFSNELLDQLLAGGTRPSSRLRRHWYQVSPLPTARDPAYATRPTRSRASIQLLKPLKIRGDFPNDEAATKLIYLVLRNISRRWRRLRAIGKRR